MYLIIMLYALFASTFSLGKVLLNYSQPVFLVGIRMFIAGSLLLTYQYLFARNKFRLQKDQWPLYVQGALFTVYIPYILRFWALTSDSMSSSKACLLYNFGPFISYVLSYLFYAEKITTKKVIGLIIGFCGLLPMLGLSLPHMHPNSTGFISLPDVAIILSVSSLSYGWILLRKLIKKYDYCPVMINGFSMFGGGLLALVTSLIVESNYITEMVPFVGILSIIILVSNFIGHNLYVSLLRKYSPTMLSFASFLTPLFAAFYGWIFLHETVSWSFYISACIVFLGLGIFYQEELKQNHLTTNSVVK